MDAADVDRKEIEDWLEERFSDEDKKLNGRQIHNSLSFATELAQAKKKFLQLMHIKRM